MKQFISIFLVILSCDVFGQAYFQQKVDHTINVSLDPTNHALNGFSTITYTNHSPDTLSYLWFHLWPNAYKNDRTAFSEQLLENGNTAFYFSKEKERGFIHQLDFKIGEKSITTENHPAYNDVIKLLLPFPLYPGKSVVITTPFHVQLPFNFSRGGWNGDTYQITQWYPKPAVYDAKGWHPMPYLNQGEFYSEFGDYTVTITVPHPFTVAATGIPQQPVENAFYAPEKKTSIPQKRNWEQFKTKTLTFKEKNIHDFAWFADPTWTLHKDTIQLPSGKIIQAQVYFHLDRIDLWQNSLQNVKDAVQMLSAWLGDYPFSHITVVDGEQGFVGGMEYPSITILTGIKNRKELDLTIFHEIGHNWFQAALANNERSSPWMDEGMNSFYEKRYESIKYPTQNRKGLFGLLTVPGFNDLLLQQQIRVKKDQPITTPSDQFTAENYSMIAYNKAASWMQYLENTLGKTLFDNAMHDYYSKWKFKHPDVHSFKKSIENSTGQNLDSIFSLLEAKGSLQKEVKKPLSILTPFQLHKIVDKQPIFINPVGAYTANNGLIGGLLIHNYSIPVPRFTMVIAPLYGFKSHQLNGWNRFGYNWYPNHYFESIELAGTISRINTNLFTDTSGKKYTLGYFKISPYLKFTFKEIDPRSTLKKSLLIRFYALQEDKMIFHESTNELKKTTYAYNILQSKFTIENTRILYPWKAVLSAESHNDFYRLHLEGKYFLNYAHKGGVNIRFFAGKFMYKSNPGNLQRLNLERYHLQMTGPKGSEDYTYSTAFLGRFDTEGFSSQQILERDGFFKVRTDLLSDKVGRSDNWLTTINMEMDIPDRLNPLLRLPIKLPLRLFLDVGTNGNIWQSTADQPRFLYDAGIQISLFNHAVNVYFPLMYSTVYRDYFRSVPGNNFFQRMSFCIKTNGLNLNKLLSTLQWKSDL